MMNFVLFGRQLLSDRKIRYLLLIFFSLQVVFLTFYYQLYNKTILSFKIAPTVTASTNLRGEIPKQIVIPSIQINLGIIPAEIENGIWQSSAERVNYLSSSARPMEDGNIVIYAHNTRNLFAALPLIEIDEEIILTGSNGNLFHYRVVETKIVDPGQVEEIMPSNTEMLTIFTCAGWFDSQRFIVKAVPVDD